MMVVIFDPIKATIIVVFWCCFIFSPSSEGFIFFLDFAAKRQCLKVIQNVSFEYFWPIFALLILIFQGSLFDHKLNVFQNSSKLTNFLCLSSFFNVARFARNVVKCDIFWEFQTL